MPVVAVKGRGGAGGDGEGVERQSLRDLGRGGRVSLQPKSVGAVIPREDDQQGKRNKEGGAVEEEFRRPL